MAAQVSRKAGWRTSLSSPGAWFPGSLTYRWSHKDPPWETGPRWRRSPGVLPETIEGYPQRPKKEIHEGPRRGWRKLKRDPPKVGKGEKISTKGDKGSVKRAKDESAKGFQGVGKDSKGIREGPRRTLRFSTNAHSKIEPISFLCTSFSSCLSCLSCVSMFNDAAKFNDAANRISETWPLLLIGIRTGCFTLE